MAVVAEELVSELVVRDGKLRAGLRSAQQAYSSGVGKMRGDSQKLEQDFNRSSASISAGFKSMAATLAAGVSTAAVGQMIDGYTRLQNQLRITGLEGEQLAEVQERLRTIASTYGTDLESLAAVYGKVSIAAKELGASSSQILQVNEAIAAALKVSGTSSEQAAGALLQFGQAMGSGVVRAEEFNSMLEGAFPLVQAAARGIDGMQGSVSKLRSAIVEGKVTSQEFFQGVIAGSPQLLEQAAKANMTLAQSFTILKNELTLYVGAAASSSGVAGALSSGIKSLADNLDRVIPALAIIAAAIGVRYVAAAASATAATVGMTIATAKAAQTQTFLNAVMASSTAIQTTYGSSVVRTTSTLGALSVAARGAGAALLAMVGGPVGAAIIALGVAMYLAQQRANDLSQASEVLQKSNARVAANAVTSKNAIDSLATAYGAARIKALELVEAQRKLAAVDVAKASQDLFKAEQNVQKASQNTGRYSGAIDQQAATDRRVAEATLAEAKKTLREVDQALAAPPASPASASAAAASTKKDGKSGRGSSGPSEQEIQDRFNAELQRGLVEIEQINAERRQNASEQAAAEVSRIRVEQQITARSIKADADYSQAQKNQLLAVNDQVAAARVAALDAEEINRLMEEKHELLQLDADIARDTLQRAYELADTQKDRRTIGLEMLDIEQRVRTAKLDELLAQENLSDAVRARAERERAAIQGDFDQRRAGVMRETESPLEKWGRESKRTTDQIKEDIESVQVDGFNALTDGITNIITGTESMGAAFKKVATQIIADLIRIQVQQLIVNSLSGLFGGGSSSSIPTPGFADLSGSIGGRAGGGRVNAGEVYRINESGQEYFRPATNGTVITPAQMNAAARSGASQQPIIVQLSVSEGALFEPTVRSISEGVSVQTVQAAAPSIVRAAGVDAQRRASRPRT